MEQKRPADIFQELLDYIWNGLGLEEKGWKRLKKLHEVAGAKPFGFCTDGGE